MPQKHYIQLTAPEFIEYAHAPSGGRMDTKHLVWKEALFKNYFSTMAMDSCNANDPHGLRMWGTRLALC